jgi:hypothetical protein
VGTWSATRRVSSSTKKRKGAALIIFYIGTGVGITVSVIYIVVGTLSFLRIRRELLRGTASELGERIRADKQAIEHSAVSVVPGFAWKATVAVVTSFAALVTASFSSVFWYVLPLTGLGTAAAVIVAFVSELRNDRTRRLRTHTVVVESVTR